MRSIFFTFIIICPKLWVFVFFQSFFCLILVVQSISLAKTKYDINAFIIKKAKLQTTQLTNYTPFTHLIVLITRLISPYICCIVCVEEERTNIADSMVMNETLSFCLKVLFCVISLSFTMFSLCFLQIGKK